DIIDEIPVSNGSRIFKKLDFHIGIIADEFLYNSFKDVANVEYISRHERENYKEYDFVIFATTWRGIDQSWVGASTANGPIRRQMIMLAEEYNDRGIPTIFYSKEDPVNYNLFKSLAKHCKYVYTSASEVVDTYKEYTGNESVDVLQFGVNPHIHNPVGTRTKYAEKYKDEILFAGSWLSKYPVRMTETSRLFNSIIEEDAPLTIIDRNLELKDPRYQFPEDYIPYITPPVKHEFLMKLHKIFRWSINMNSVKYSDTMFANRVYELQAFGNLLLSNYNTGINNIFPNVRLINAPDDFKVIYKTDEEDLKELQAKGIRSVMKEHTTFHRILKLAEDVGLKTPEIKKNILAILENETVKEHYDRQIYETCDYIYKSDFTIDKIISFYYITFFNSGYIYEEYYIVDMISVFNYTDVDFVTKNNEVEAHNYIDNIVYTSKVMIDVDAITDLNTINQLTSGYNLDGVEVLSKAEYNSKIKNLPSDKELSVVVPIHNNGT